MTMSKLNSSVHDALAIFTRHPCRETAMILAESAATEYSMGLIGFDSFMEILRRVFQADARGYGMDRTRTAHIVLSL